MTVCAIEWKHAQKTWPEWLRRILGVDLLMFIGQNVLGIASPLGLFSVAWYSN